MTTEEQRGVAEEERNILIRRALRQHRSNMQAEMNRFAAELDGIQGACALRGAPTTTPDDIRELGWQVSAVMDAFLRHFETSVREYGRGMRERYP